MVSEAGSEKKYSGKAYRVLRIMYGIPEAVIVFLMIAILFDMLISTISRYIFANPIYWGEEVGIFGLIWMTMIGAGLAIKKKAHIVMPTFKFSHRIGFIISLTVHGLIIIFGLAMVLIGLEVVSYSSTTISPALGINMAIINCSSIISGILILIYEGQQIVEKITKA